MARLPRLAVAGLPHLVIQHGRGAKSVFVDDADRRRYLEALLDAARACTVAIHAYVLTDHQVCLLLTPADRGALGRFMLRVGRRYVPSFNLRHGTQGSIWAGRFRSTVIEPERYLLTAIRFVEQAPVRAALVAQAQDWPWSSAAHHGGRQSSPLITDHPAYWRLGNTPFEREAKHEFEVREMLAPDLVAALQDAARGGWPLGSPAFVTSLRQACDRPVQPRPRGRPSRAV
jgi:putative transposase